MILLNQLEEGGTAYTMPLAVRLTGPLQTEILETCINEVRRRHEVLRTTVETKEGRPIPLVHPFEKSSLPIVGLQKIPENQRESEFQRQAVQEIHQPFDLVCGPQNRVP